VLPHEGAETAGDTLGKVLDEDGPPTVVEDEVVIAI